AIGAGISLVEIQQNRDVTYRLYDYGRQRELHLDQGIAVACGAPHDAALRRRLPTRGNIALVEGPWFRLDRVDGPPSEEIAAHYTGPLLAIPLTGTVTIGDEEITPGQCAVAANLTELAVAQDALCLLAHPCASRA